jgi:hypothetical protein
MLQSELFAVYAHGCALDKKVTSQYVLLYDSVYDVIIALLML